jgi:hypothetical protein
MRGRPPLPQLRVEDDDQAVFAPEKTSLAYLPINAKSRLPRAVAISSSVRNRALDGNPFHQAPQR